MASSSRFIRKMKSLAIVAIGGGIAFSGISLYRGNSKFYSDIALPMIHEVLEPETAHRFGVVTAGAGLIPKSKVCDSQILETSFWGLKIKNPIGLAAGFDKNCEAVPGIFKAGFGFVEIGSVTPLPQPGNPKPRVFRLKNDLGIINNYGFNNEGQDYVYNRLQKIKENQPNLIIGVNLGRNKDSASAIDDYKKGVLKFGELADYLVINISSPNTPGLRSLQKRKLLEELLDNVLEVRNKLFKKTPLLVKISPDTTYSEREDIAKAVKRKGKEVDGLIVSNTTISRPDNLIDLVENDGGLSGKPLTNMSTEAIRDMFVLTEGKMLIIGVGGVFTGRDAYEKIKAGASLIQLYTALVYKGPPVVTEIKKELEDLLRADGYANIIEAVGADIKWGERNLPT
ncbi:dihydroorotate dehydrogenase (quinone), mitochondrial-like [Centruroides sculpturatus]|uniref:dihydroorotate dehydrogenase (quinone), mitochondrial-like n=2 Tax=Centruroides sculpturatus TaxID=218467 RepID=UPI000C6D592A|nr:dihydroorotate dehydrogenase (quinone), mitochondrial-like [Centruroides sculpturatus]